MYFGERPRSDANTSAAGGVRSEIAGAIRSPPPSARGGLADRVELLPACEQAVDLAARGFQVCDQRLDLGRAILEHSRIRERGLERAHAILGSGDGVLHRLELARFLEGELARADRLRSSAGVSGVTPGAAVASIRRSRAALGVERVAALVEG